MDEPLPVPTIEKDAHREASFPVRDAIHQPN